MEYLDITISRHKTHDYIWQSFKNKQAGKIANQALIILTFVKKYYAGLPF